MQYKAEIILDKNKKVLASGVYDKPRFYPPEGGSSTLNSTVDRPDIIQLAVDFLSGIEWMGMGDCDIIVDPADGVPKLMEVNPRFTRSIKVLIVAGLEYPWLLYRLALGLPCEPQYDYIKGLYLRYFISDCVWFLRSKDRFRAKPSWFKFFGRNMHEELFSWSDPLPSFVFTLSMFLRLFSAKERKFLLRTKKRN
jgi:predicted ATP-grasp superfamily ATP-dependent carboligase